jgi:hypothetical protein
VQRVKATAKNSLALTNTKYRRGRR